MNIPFYLAKHAGNYIHCPGVRFPKAWYGHKFSWTLLGSGSSSQDALYGTASGE